LIPHGRAAETTLRTEMDFGERWNTQKGKRNWSVQSPHGEEREQQRASDRQRSESLSRGL